MTDRGTPRWPSAEKHHVVGDIDPGYMSLTSFCESLENALRPRRDCLLWVTDWHIWHENRHLYYRLRQSYGDNRLIHEAPGHLFLDFESPDLVTFLQVAILNGWDAHLIPTEGYARAFVSHDEFVEFASDDKNAALVEEYRKRVTNPKPPASA